MKKIKYKKIAICVFSISLLLLSLYLSTNYDNIGRAFIETIKNKIYASEMKEDSGSNKANNEKNSESSTSTSKENTGNDMVELLARLINGEARGEPYQGQVAVGAVILNRVKSPKFPNTISGVIYQNNQFSCIKDGQFDQPMEKDSTVYKAAQEAINGSDPSNGALYFYNPSKTKSKWLYALPKTATIGEHVFALGE